MASPHRSTSFGLASELADPRGRALWAEQVRSSSKLSPGSLLAVRLVLACLMWGVLVWDYLLYMHDGTWCLYLTHWTLMLQCLYLGFGAATSCALWQGWKVPEATLAANSVLATLVFPSTLLVAVMFWVMDFPLWNISVIEYATGWPTGIAKHGINLIVTLVDVLLVEQPMFWGDARYPVLYALAYVSFNCWYFLNGGRDASGNPWTYAALNWTEHFSSSAKLAAAVLAVAVPLACLLLWALTGHRSGDVKSLFADQFLQKPWPTELPLKLVVETKPVVPSMQSGEVDAQVQSAEVDAQDETAAVATDSNSNGWEGPQKPMTRRAWSLRSFRATSSRRSGDEDKLSRRSWLQSRIGIRALKCGQPAYWQQKRSD